MCVTSIFDWYIAIMVFTEYTKKRILFYHAKGRRALTIAKLLEEEGVVVSRQGVDASLVRVLQTGDIARHPGRGQPSMRTDEVEVVKQLKSLLALLPQLLLLFAQKRSVSHCWRSRNHLVECWP